MRVRFNGGHLEKLFFDYQRYMSFPARLGFSILKTKTQVQICMLVSGSARQCHLSASLVLASCTYKYQVSRNCEPSKYWLWPMKK